MEGAGAEPRGLDSIPALPQAAAGPGDKSDAVLVAPTGRRPQHLALRMGLQLGVKHPQPQAGRSAHTHPRLGHAEGLDKPSRKYCIAALSSIPPEGHLSACFFP